MDELLMLALAALVLLGVIAVLPIVAIVRTAKIRGLERRIEGLEAALLRVMRQQPQPAEAPPPPRTVPQPQPADVVQAPAARPAWQTETLRHQDGGEPGRKLEEIIGERWLGWAGVAVLLFGAAFGLKYAFDNRWIGELGRVAMGVGAGVIFTGLGWQRHRVGWRHLSQALTAGGVTLLYLSIYAAYGFYDLIPPTAAFLLLVVIVAETHFLAVAYRSWPIALWGQIGGFLTPLLLSTGEDRYWVLFPYLLLLAAGAAAVCVVRQWRWVASVSLMLSQLVYWAWYDEHFQSEKLWPAVAFQLALFALFAWADLTAVRTRGLEIENWVRIFANPIAFFAALYVLLQPQYPDWMGAAALLLALFYAAVGRWSLKQPSGAAEAALAAAGVSLIFVTAAIPIQLEANWITFAWGAQAVVLAWLAVRFDSLRLRIASLLVFLLALTRLVVADTPWVSSANFRPLLNEYFLTAFALALFLIVAARLIKDVERAQALGYAFAAIVLTWFALTFEIHRYTESLTRQLAQGDYEGHRALDLAGNMAVSVLWSCYATALVVGGLKIRSSLLRWAGLALFGLTLAKAFLVDIPSLEGIYRFVALVALGLLLIVAAWGYQRLAKAGSAEAQPS